MPKMKAYASFDLYLADQPSKNRALIRRVRAFVARVAPGVVEGVKWGNGCWLLDGGPIAYVYSDKDHVQFGFVRGSALTDPAGKLLGQGQYVRHIKLRVPSDLDEEACTAWLLEAVRLGPVQPGKRGAEKRKKVEGSKPRRSGADTKRKPPAGRQPR
jgi:hypothetical protein